MAGSLNEHSIALLLLLFVMNERCITDVGSREVKPKRKEEERIEDSSALDELQSPGWNARHLSVVNYRQGASSAVEWPSSGVSKASCNCWTK